MAVRLSTAARNAVANAVVDLADAGAGAGVIEVRTGAQPASADDSASGTLLVTFTLADPAFGSAATGTASGASLPRSGTAVGAGTAGWARMLDSDGGKIVDLSVTADGGGGQVELNTTTIAVGLTVNLTAISFSCPAS